MTTQEFSNEFDILYNNVMSNQAPGLNEYEKSVFLTKAQSEILKNYFNPQGNKYGLGFDDSAKRQIDFSSLVTICEPVEQTSPAEGFVKFDERSKLYTMPADIMFVLNETALNTADEHTRLINIVPISFQEYARLMSRPYKQPQKNQGWRIFRSSDGVDILSEVVIKYNSTITNYKVRYVRRPLPIILADLTDEYSSVSIDGKTTVTECELDPILHPEILQRAVELAKAAYTGELKETVELGQRSE